MAVTVDLLTTGIDVPQITTLVFMRRVKSRILFEQMLGRATRRCDEIGKTHFEIFDSVGVYESIEPVITMKPVVANPTATLAALIESLTDMADAEHINFQVGQIVGKMRRKMNYMDETDKERFALHSDGKTSAEVAAEINAAQEPQEKKECVMRYAAAITSLDNLTKSERAAVISDKKDELLYHGRGYGKNNDMRPEDYLDAFAAYLKNNMNEIAALNILCTRPKDLTRESLKKLRLILDSEGFTEKELNTAISAMTNTEITADIIGIIRRYAINAELIDRRTRIAKAIEKIKAAHSFSKQELNWLGRIEKYLQNETIINEDIFNAEYPFKSDGFVKINKVFRGKLKDIVAELNEYLYDDGGHAA